MHKTCACCGQEKEPGEFGRDMRRSDGLNPYCRECVKAKSRARYGDPDVRRRKAERIQAWRDKNPEKVRQYSKKSRDKNRGRLRSKKAAEYAENKDEIATYLRCAAFKRKYGITLTQRDSLAAAQGHRCLICLEHESNLDKRLAVDHDHKSGRIRGLLCQNCNFGIGHFGDNPSLLRAAVWYVERRQVPEDFPAYDTTQRSESA